MDGLLVCRPHPVTYKLVIDCYYILNNVILYIQIKLSESVSFYLICMFVAQVKGESIYVRHVTKYLLGIIDA